MAGAKGKPAKAPVKGAATKPGAGAPPPAQAVTDKFGLMLLVLVAILLIANIVVWNSAGVKHAGVTIFGTGMGAAAAADYNQEVPQGQLMSYAASGQIGQRPGQIDTAVINRGSHNGVRVGDVFTLSSAAGFDTAKYFVEFSVYHVDDASCRAHIITNMSLDVASDNASVVRLVDQVKPESTTVRRTWTDQRVRRVVSGDLK